MNYLEKVKANIFPKSKEKKNLPNAFLEWSYYGEFYDTGLAEEICELCDHPNLRYQFNIKNKFTSNELLVGSECIKKFNVKYIDSYGRIFEGSERNKKLNSDIKQAIETSNRDKLYRAMESLLPIEDPTKIKDFIHSYKRKGSFTPNQLNYLIWRFEKNNIEYTSLKIKIRIKKEYEKNQLLVMQDWQLKKLIPFLSTSQNTWLIINKRH